MSRRSISKGDEEGYFGIAQSKARYVFIEVAKAWSKEEDGMDEVLAP